MIYLDLDDFAEDNNCLPRLRALREKVPQLKVTLFTIPGRCSFEFVQRLITEESDWLDLVPHGFIHDTNRECEHWTQEDMESLMKLCVSMGFKTLGFKAPGWQISEGCYNALLVHGWWVADQQYNNHRHPDGLLLLYVLDAPHKIHGHVGHLGGHNANELEYLIPEILKHAGEPFGFVRDVAGFWGYDFGLLCWCGHESSQHDPKTSACLQCDCKEHQLWCS